VQSFYLLRQQLTEPDLDIAGTAHWHLQLHHRVTLEANDHCTTARLLQQAQMSRPNADMHAAVRRLVASALSADSKLGVVARDQEKSNPPELFLVEKY